MSPAKKKTRGAQSSSSKKAPRKPTGRKKSPAKKTAAKAKTKSVRTPKSKTPKPKTSKPKPARVKPAKAPATRHRAKPAVVVAPRRTAPSPKRRARRRKPPPSPALQALPSRTPVGAQTTSKLGAKWECFGCGVKFYDLNKPEPVCPRCDANQHDRPKPESKSRGRRDPASQPRRSRAMAPLLEEDDEAVVVVDRELDLGLAAVDTAAAGFIGGAEDEEETADEEEEES